MLHNATERKEGLIDMGKFGILIVFGDLIWPVSL